jgi:hypothetical protein
MVRSLPLLFYLPIKKLLCLSPGHPGVGGDLGAGHDRLL